MKRILFALLFISGSCFAQELIVDPSFNPGGSGFAYNEMNGGVYDTELLSDGRIVVAGIFTSYNGTEINNIAILHPDGILDTSFNPGSGTDSMILTVEVDANDNIYIGGFFESYNGVTKLGIAKLDTNGVLDTTFNVSFEFGSVPHIKDIEIADNGQIYFCGTFYTNDGHYAVSRLNSDGTTDTSFYSGFNNFDQADDLFLNSDGSLYICGFFQSNALYKFKPDGTLDAVFNSNVQLRGLSSKVLVGVDNKAVVAGTFGLTEADHSMGNYKLLARLNSDGTTDNDYNAYPLLSAPNNTEKITTMSYYNNKLLIGGNIHVDNSFYPMLFIDANGQISDTPSVGSGFIPSETYTGSYSTSLYSSFVLPNNKILLGGFFDGFNGAAGNSFIRIGDSQDMAADTFNAAEVYVYNNGGLVFESSSELISKIEIYDALGRIVRNVSGLSDNSYHLDMLESGQIYFAKVTLANNFESKVKIAL